MSSLPSGGCDACGTTVEKLKLCSQCKQARYCSVTCQKRSWKHHKGVCKRAARALRKEKESPEEVLGIERQGPGDGESEVSIVDSPDWTAVPISANVEGAHLWEKQLLDASPQDICKACYDISTSQLNLQRAKQWLEIGSKAGGTKVEEALILKSLLTCLLHGDGMEKDEAVAWLKYYHFFLQSGNTAPSAFDLGELRFINEECLEFAVNATDRNNRHSHRHLVRTLLSGSLEKNHGTIIHKSFFRSSTREVHLLPLIASYLSPLRINNT